MPLIPSYVLNSLQFRVLRLHRAETFGNRSDTYKLRSSPPAHLTVLLLHPGRCRPSLIITWPAQQLQPRTINRSCVLLPVVPKLLFCLSRCRWRISITPRKPSCERSFFARSTWRYHCSRFAKPRHATLPRWAGLWRWASCRRRALLGLHLPNIPATMVSPIPDPFVARRTICAFSFLRVVVCVQYFVTSVVDGFM